MAQAAQAAQVAPAQVPAGLDLHCKLPEQSAAQLTLDRLIGGAVALLEGAVALQQPVPPPVRFFCFVLFFLFFLPILNRFVLTFHRF